jgi:hypothetical protein
MFIILGRLFILSATIWNVEGDQPMLSKIQLQGKLFVIGSLGEKSVEIKAILSIDHCLGTIQ